MEDDRRKQMEHRLVGKKADELLDLHAVLKREALKLCCFKAT